MGGVCKAAAIWQMPHHLTQTFLSDEQRDWQAHRNSEVFIQKSLR
jgi:hypothetical protein